MPTTGRPHGKPDRIPSFNGPIQWTMQKLAFVQEGGVARADDAHVFCTARLANSVRRVQTQQASPRQNSAGRLGASELLPPSLQAPLVGCKATWTTTTRCTFELHKVNWHAPAMGDGFSMGPASLSPQVTARTSISHMLWLWRQGRPRVRGDQFARHLPSTAPTALSVSGQFVVRSRMPSMRAQHLRFAVRCSSRRHRA